MISNPQLVEELGRTFQDPVRRALWGKTLKELRNLADSSGTTVEGTQRWALVDALTANPQVRTRLAPKVGMPSPKRGAAPIPPPSPPAPATGETTLHPEQALPPPPPPVVEAPPPSEAPLTETEQAPPPELPVAGPSVPPPPKSTPRSDAMEVALNLPPRVFLIPEKPPEPSAPPASQAPSSNPEDLILELLPEDEEDEVGAMVEGLMEAPEAPVQSAPLHPLAPRVELPSQVSAALAYAGDLGHLHELMVEADQHMRSGDYTTAIALAREAITQAEASWDRYLRSAWAHVLTSLGNLLNGIQSPNRAVEEAVSLTREAAEHFDQGELVGQADLLERIQRAVSSLALSEMDLMRRQVDAGYELLREIAAMGSDVAVAQDTLTAAAEALRSGDRGKGMELLRRAQVMASEAREKRVAEIRSSLASLEAVIREARTVGAEPSEALKMVDQTQVALDQGEFVLANELAHRAERAALEAERTQLDRALKIHERQVVKVREGLKRMKPILTEAQSYGLDTNLPRTLAREAVAELKRGDHLRALLFARQAAEAIKALQPAMLRERARRGITKPEAGTCERCSSPRLEYSDDGWAHCPSCGWEFRWRRSGTQGFLHHFRRP